MANVARAFDQQNQTNVLRDLPSSVGPSRNELPWATISAGAMPPLMFELRFQDGSFSSFAYSDIRQIRCPNAGRVELYLYAMGKLVIAIEGRHLRELASCFGSALVRRVQEADPREPETPEEEPAIVSIIVEQLAD